MRTLKIVAITAALILIPVGVVSATVRSPGGPASFNCKPWAELSGNVISVNSTSVTFRTLVDDETIKWTISKNGGVLYDHLLFGPPPTPYTYILTPQDIAATPNAAVNSFSGHQGMIIRRSFNNTSALGIYHCTY